MLSITRKTDYALVALALLAGRWHGGQGPVSARLIAGTYGLPHSLLMNILKELAGAGMLTSTRGASGGYMLAVAPADISVADVITTLEGPVRFALCIDGEKLGGDDCPIGDVCPIRGPINRLHEQLNEFLRNMSIDDLLRQDDGIEGAGVCGCHSAVSTCNCQVDELVAAMDRSCAETHDGQKSNAAGKCDVASNKVAAPGPRS